MIDSFLYWVSGFSAVQILSVVAGMLLLDTPRYAISNFLMVLYDTFKTAVKHKPHYPSVCVVIAGHNEEEVITKTLSSLHGTYPSLEMVVVDDGSTDDTYKLALEFSKTHSGVKVIRRPNRCGKGSAVNMGLLYCKAEIVLVVDSDTVFGKGAILNIVQPFRDPKVGAVSGAIHIRNTFQSLATWFQAYEYLSTIQVGRVFSSRMGTLSTASGAFSAFRMSAVKSGCGWDASVSEDLDITLRLRKSGWKIVFTSVSECYTNGPETFKSLYKQRLRWDRGYVRYELRKHNGIGSLFWNNFRLSSFIYFYEQLLFNVVLTFTFWVTSLYLLITVPLEGLIKSAILIIGFYTLFSLFQTLVILYYSNNWKRDLPICLAFPLTVFYSVFLKAARVHAIVQEVFTKASYDDSYVPKHIQRCIRKTFLKF